MGRPEAAQAVCSTVKPLNHLGLRPLVPFIFWIGLGQAAMSVGNRQKSAEYLVFIRSPTEDSGLIFCSHWARLQEEVDPQLTKEADVAW